MKTTHLTTILAVASVVSTMSAAAEDEQPAFKKAVPQNYFTCRADNECVVVQGWCATFAINKAHADEFARNPAFENGKANLRCPPGWLPPKPQAVCVTQQCTIEEGLP